ncbi:MAG: DNA replication and repair protein RecF [Bacteroidales bacterium]|nr:DNA replication and repair protein RecF [Bacteroidales bacterium]
MFLSELTIQQFKNISEAHIEFSPNLNFIYGENGAGKTTILDAIHYLSITKSFLNANDNENIKSGSNFFRITGVYNVHNSFEEYSCIFKSEGRKQFKYFSKDYNRLADHIGKLPLVVISPLDHFIISEGSEFRRKLLDATISQYDKFYLSYLIEYNRLIKQRNALLKSEQLIHVKNEMLDIIDSQLEKPASYVFNIRKKFISTILPIFLNTYMNLSQKQDEVVSLEYKSSLFDNSLFELLKQNRLKDIQAETTTIGIHKDDIIFYLNNKTIRYYASQGQQKTYLTAIKLAILKYFKQHNEIPILLLDDIFDKLDEKRVNHLIKTVINENIQVFITHTNLNQFEKLEKSSDFCIFEVTNGKVNELKTPKG